MSHAQQTDLRIRRTHKFLQEAMIELITEKGFEAITVGDIVERAMINRTTFYRHYQDKYDLVARIFEEAVNHMVEDMKPLRKDSDPDEKVEIWHQFFEHVGAHARLYRAMLGKNGSPWFAARMREHITRLILEREQWKQQAASSQLLDPTMPPELPVMQLSHVLIGTVIWWLESEKNYTPGQVATWFWRFAFSGYLSAHGYEVPLSGKDR
uniref:TetR family transcriptional regulator n=1 Tax=Thermosporothrix sp. COM3 TaxID=2490863 RepID=A0A455SEB7_9CHLR|nr:TetR family transcriptional regulator [Thermosporothrix sp. COM3]